jgi:flagellin-like protein
MKFTHKRAISPIIATLLLIAIAVAAGIIVYVFVNGLSGNLTQGGGAQTTERLQMQGYNFNVGSLQVVQIFMVNSGGATTTISAVYFDGVSVPIAGTNPPTSVAAASFASAYVYAATTSNCVITIASSTFYCAAAPAATAQTSYTVQTTGAVEIGVNVATNPLVAGTSHTVKVVSSTGATYVFAVIAGRTG